MPAELTFLVGSYTQPEAHVPQACGEGIVTLSLDPETGGITRRGVFSGILNPSYLAYDAGNRHVFAVSENIGGEGEVWQFELSHDGGLVPLSRQPSHGAATCHVAALPGDLVCAASYLGGCIAVYPVENGILEPARRVFLYRGSGANPQRQEASHAHQIVVAPGERWFHVCDLGSDCVWRHDIHATDEPRANSMPAGHGPRHMVFHPKLPRAWVLGELTGSVITCDWDAETGSLTAIGSTREIEEDASAAAIRLHPSLRTLWISLRKHPSLMAFQLDDNGLPVESTAIPLDAGEPRDFAFSPDGRWLIAANQSSDELVIIEIDPATGLPTGSSQQHFSIATPVCVIFLTKPILS